MLRISFSADDSNSTIHIDGKLLAPWIGEVRTAVSRATRPGAVRLDLAGLTFADQAGLEFLQELTATGVAIENASPFIHELLASSSRHIR
jgi:ABC-type transporter Mla MlaB component